MRILGIDPGYERLGIAVLEKTPKQKDILIFSDCYQTDKSSSHPDRLLGVLNKCREVIDQYAPEALGIEILFFSGNQKTALSVSEVRGVLLALAAERNLEILEFTPGEIKMAVTGYGKASKEQITLMVQTLLSFKKKAFDDEFDAIAVALTASAHIH